MRERRNPCQRRIQARFHKCSKTNCSVQPENQSKGMQAACCLSDVCPDAPFFLVENGRAHSHWFRALLLLSPKEIMTTQPASAGGRCEPRSPRKKKCPCFVHHKKQASDRNNCFNTREQHSPRLEVPVDSCTAGRRNIG